MDLFSIAFSLFLLMDSIGNVPLFLAFLKNYDAKRQKQIIMREMLIALVIIIVFSFVGDFLMQFLHISNDTIQIAGGIILFLISLRMIFPSPHDAENKIEKTEEPFIVPMAVPLIAGPSVLATVMIYAKQEMSSWIMVGAIFIAWASSLVVLLAAPFLKTYLGDRGLMALERLMGLVLTLIAVQMFLTGIGTFIRDFL
jgi:multiple antibiotic resistance protein